MMSRTERMVGYSIVICAFAAAVLILLPWSTTVRQEAWEKIYHTYDFRQLTKDEAMQKIRQASDRTMGELPNLSVDTVYENFKLVNLFRDGPYQSMLKDAAVSAGIQQLAELNVNTLDAMHARLNIRTRYQEMREADPEFLAVYKPEETVWHWSVLQAHTGRMLPYSMLFVIIGFIGLLRLWGFAKLVNVTGCAVSFLFSVAGGAVAQTVKKAAEEKKNKTEHTLQIDARTSLFVNDGPPNPNLFLRVTNVTPKTLVESISTFNPRSRNWSTEVASGIWVPGMGKTQVLAMGVISDSIGGGTRVGLGTQIYRGGSKGFLAVPVFRWERNIKGPPEYSFAVVANPNIKMGMSRWSLAPDVGVRWTQNRPWAWFAGIALRFTPDKGKRQYEQGILTNQSDFISLRSRFLASVTY